MEFTLPATAALWFLPFALPVCIWVAWSDMAFMKIPNKAVLSLCAVYLVIGPIALPLEMWAWQWLNLVVILAGGFVLNMLGSLGAGDAKFAAAAAPFVPVQDSGTLLILMAAVILAAFATHRAARATPALRRMVPGWASWTHRKFPMGFPLAGTLLAFLGLAASGI